MIWLFYDVMRRLLPSSLGPAARYLTSGELSHHWMTDYPGLSINLQKIKLTFFSVSC